MDRPSAEVLDAETARVRAAYGRRPSGALYARTLPGQLFMMQELERHMLAALDRSGMLPLEGRRILDVGCGNGAWIRQLIQWGATPALVTGVDVLPSRLEDARRQTAPGVELREGNAACLDLPDAHFDIVLQATLFTSVLDPALRRLIAGEMLRVLCPGGIVVWYDFLVDNPRNPDVRGVRRREIEALFPNSRVRRRRLTLAPPLVRVIAPRSWLLCHLLSGLPFLCTHYLAIISPS